MALEDFWGVFDHGGDFSKNIADDAHANQSQHWQAHFRRADLGVVAQDDAGVFQLPYALDDGWRGQADAPRKLSEAQSAMLLQVMKQLAVGAVDGKLFL
jgi:hypothetical protein